MPFAHNICRAGVQRRWLATNLRQVNGLKYNRQDLVIVGISLDRGGIAAVKKFIQKEGVNYPIVSGTEEVVGAFGVKGINNDRKP